MITRRGWGLAVILTGLAACASPEASRVRGGGPGADLGNHDAVTQLHQGAKMYYRTPCRTVKVKCSGPMPAFGKRGAARPPRARSDGGAAPAPGLRPPLGERAASHLVGGLLSALRGVAGGGRVHRARAQASAALRTLRHGVGDPTAALRVL